MKLILSLLVAAAPALASDMPSKPIAVVDGNPVYGVEMPAGDAVNIGSALQNVAGYADKPTKFSGKITQVCQTKGCWLVLAEGDSFARVMFGKHDFYIPKDTTGRAVVYGTLTVKDLDEKTAKHLADDAGRDPNTVTGPEKEYRVTATSVMLQPAS
jgi:hypothetical protein